MRHVATLSSALAVIMAVPTAMALTLPVAVTVAIELLSLLHSALRVVEFSGSILAVSVTSSPGNSVIGPLGLIATEFTAMTLFTSSSPFPHATIAIAVISNINLKTFISVML